MSTRSNIPNQPTTVKKAIAKSSAKTPKKLSSKKQSVAKSRLKPQPKSSPVSKAKAHLNNPSTKRSNSVDRSDPTNGSGISVPTKKEARERFKQLIKEISPQQVANLKAMPYQDFLESKYWKVVRDYKISLSDGCAFCATNSSLQVHHRRYTHRGEEYKHLKDLEVFCKSCHHWNHRKPPANKSSFQV